MPNELTVITQSVVVVSATNPAVVYLASLAEGSKRTIRSALQRLSVLATGANCAFDTMPWHELRNEHIQAIRAHLSEQYSPATANLHLAALRSVLKVAWRMQLMTTDDYHRAIDVPIVKGQKIGQAEKGRHLTTGELTALINVCLDSTKTGVRDVAMIAIGYTAGLRRAELAALQVEDYNPDASTILIRHGKGNKERIVPIAGNTVAALQDWLHVRGTEPGPLFMRIRKGSQLTGDGMTDQAIYVILQTRAEQAGVKKFSPHDLRRTFAGDLLDAGTDIVTVQKLMGHANVSTTADYDRRDAKAKQRAVNHLHISYTRQFD